MAHSSVPRPVARAGDFSLVGPECVKRVNLLEVRAAHGGTTMGEVASPLSAPRTEESHGRRRARDPQL